MSASVVPSAGVRRVVAIVLVVTATVPYLGALDGGFFYDDWSYFLEGTTETGPRVKPLLDVPPGEQLRIHNLRTFTFLTYQMDYRLGGADPDDVDPWPFHTTNLAIHALTVLAAWFVWRGVARRLGLVHGFFVATFAALLFGLHPLATEAVNYPSARGSSLVALFAFTGTACLLAGWSTRGRRRALAWCGVLPAFLLAAYSKEAGVAVPLGVAVGAIFVVESHRLRAVWGRLAVGGRIALTAVPLIAVVLFALWLLHPALEPARPGGLDDISARLLPRLELNDVVDNEVYGLGGTFRFTKWNFWMTQTRCFWSWLSLVAAPWGRQTIDHPVVWNDGLQAPWTTLPALVALIAGLLAVVVVPPRFGGLPALAAFGGFVVFVGLAPNFIIPDLQPMLEYRYVTGLAGASLLLATIVFGLYSALIERGARTAGRVVAIAAIALVVALGTGTLVRNQSWSNGIALWQDAVRKAPDRLRPRNELALAYYNARHLLPSNVNRTIEILGDLRREHPGYVRGLSNLGAVLAEQGRSTEAIEVLEEMRRRPRVMESGLVQLGMLYEEAGRREEALAVWREGSESFDPPLDALTIAFRARLASELGLFGEVAEAGDRFWQVTTGRPWVENEGEVALLHADALFRLARLDEALPAVRRAGREADTPARAFRAIVLHGDVQKARGNIVLAADEYLRAVGMILDSPGPLDADVLVAVGDAAMGALTDANDDARLRETYERIRQALPESHRPTWRERERN